MATKTCKAASFFGTPDGGDLVELPGRVYVDLVYTVGAAVLETLKT